MIGSHAAPRRWFALVAVAAGVAAFSPGCRRPEHGHHRPPSGGATTTVTTVPDAEPTRTTTTATPPTDDHGGHHGGDDPGTDDKGWSQLHNGHQADHGSVPLDAATQAELDRQLAVTQQLVERFPNAAAADAAGYHRAGPFSPGLGTHYLPPGNGLGPAPATEAPMTDEQILDPVLIFDGNELTAPLVGFMYMVIGPEVTPEGFAGPNDHWHNHKNVCIAEVNGILEIPLGADRDITPEQCAAVGGNLVAITGHMLHVWTVPGWDNPDGLFAELNPRITCEDGTYWKVPEETVGATLSLCRDANGS
jgi:hypothetical protein